MNERLSFNSASAPAVSFVPARSGWLQRKCACGGTPGPSGECEECRKNKLRRKTRNSEPGTGNDSFAPPIVHEVLRSPGQPLDAAARAFMEPRFAHDFSRVRASTMAEKGQIGLKINQPGDAHEREADRMSERIDGMSQPDASARHDFSEVRVHTNAQAAESARMINAMAYTVGKNIVFGAGQYVPNSPQGKRLLAHELAHVAQQEGATAIRQIQRKVVDDNAHVTCRTTRPGAVAGLTSAEADAIALAQGAAQEIRSRLALHSLIPAVGESPGLRTFRDLLWRRFHFDYNQPWVRNTMLPILARRFDLVADWIGRLNHRYVCGAAGVEPPGDCTTRAGQGNAWTATGVNRTQLCEGFWTRPADDLAETILHEWFHFGFEWLGDCEQRHNQNNTKCYDMFAAELAGTATAANYAACCAPPAGALPPLAGP